MFRISGEDFSGLNLLFRIDTGGVDFFRILAILALGVKIEGEEGGADVDGGPLDDLGVVSPFQNVTVWMEGLATRHWTCAPDGLTNQPLTD